jgi:hypothetical protein
LKEYALLNNNAVLMIRFTGGYDGADVDNAVLAIIKHLGVEQGRCIKSCILDLEQVESMTLRDTDFARRDLWLRQLQAALGLTGAIHEHLSQIDFCVVEPRLDHLREIYHERLRRVNNKREAVTPTFIPASAVATRLAQAGVPENEVANIFWLTLDKDVASSL